MVGDKNRDYSQVATSEDADVQVAITSTHSEALIDSNNFQPTVGVPMVEVVAPGTLPEGYKFDAQVGSQLVSVTVPAGGVEEGQRFTIPLVMPGNSSANNNNSSSNSNNNSSSFNVHAFAQPRIQIPVGSWRDHWCNFCGLGCCHAVLCNAYWCTPVLLGQVMMRMKLNFLGDEGAPPSTVALTFRVVLGVFILYIVLDPFLAFYWIPGTTINTMRNILNYIFILANPINVSDVLDDDYDIQDYKKAHGGSGIIQKPLWLMDFVFINLIFAILFFVYMVMLMVKTRRHIRNRYAIPEQYCPTGCEDICCSIWCPCCSVSQMARHTADYEVYPPTCCGETGLPAHVPDVV